METLSGINAVSVGFMVAAFILLLHPMGINLLSISIVTGTFLLLVFTKIRTPVLIFAGVILGILL